MHLEAVQLWAAKNADVLARCEVCARSVAMPYSEQESGNSPSSCLQASLAIISRFPFRRSVEVSLLRMAVNRGTVVLIALALIVSVPLGVIYLHAR